MSFPVIIIFLVLYLWFVICLPLLGFFYSEGKLSNVYGKSYNIDDSVMECLYYGLEYQFDGIKLYCSKYNVEDC